MRSSSGRPQPLWPQHGKLLELGVVNSGRQNSCFSEQDSQHKCAAAAKHRIQGQNKHSVLIKFPRVAEDAWFQAFRQRLQLVWQKKLMENSASAWRRNITQTWAEPERSTNQQTLCPADHEGHLNGSIINHFHVGGAWRSPECDPK